MSKKDFLVIIVILIISAFLTSCVGDVNAVTIYNKALEKREDVLRPHETASLKIKLMSGDKEYETFSHQEIILDKSLGISAGTVKIEGADKSTVFQIYERNGYTYIKSEGSEVYKKSPNSKQFIPDIREEYVQEVREILESKSEEEREDLEDLISINKNEDTGDFIITSKIRCEKIETIMFEMVKDSIANEQIKKEVSDETIEKMKEAVKKLEVNISEEEIKKAVNEQIKKIDDKFQGIVDQFSCEELKITLVINKDGCITKESVYFRATEEDGKRAIEIQLDYGFKGIHEGPIDFPNLTKDNVVDE